MIHVIWSGKGFLVAVIVFGFSLVANLTTNALTGNGVYWDAHKWPLAVSLFASATVCLPLGFYFRERKAQVLIDPKTQKEVTLRESHTLFFIPVLWWSPILAAFGLVAFGVEFLK